MSTLLELSQDLRDLEGVLEQADDEEARRIALDAFLATERSLNEKLDGYAGLITELRLRAEARQKEADRLRELAQSDSRKADQLVDRLKWFWQEQGLEKVETARYRIAMVRNGGQVPMEVDSGEENLRTLLRWGFAKTEERIVPLKDEIRKALTEGHEIPGCSLGERGWRMTIK